MAVGIGVYAKKDSAWSYMAEGWCEAPPSVQADIQNHFTCCGLYIFKFSRTGQHRADRGTETDSAGGLSGWIGLDWMVSCVQCSLFHVATRVFRVLLLVFFLFFFFFLFFPTLSDSKGSPAVVNSTSDAVPPACPNNVPSDPYAAYPDHGAFGCVAAAAAALHRGVFTFPHNVAPPRGESGGTFLLVKRCAHLSLWFRCLGFFFFLAFPPVAVHPVLPCPAGVTKENGQACLNVLVSAFNSSYQIAGGCAIAFAVLMVRDFLASQGAAAGCGGS
jgi:hypothetical protein